MRMIILRQFSFWARSDMQLVQAQMAVKNYLSIVAAP